MNQLTLKLDGTDSFLVQEAYKFLRTNIQFCGQDIKTIVITSCSENEGKTTVTLFLAKAFAELGKRTLVIDADMRKSVMAGRNLGAKNIHGLSELLTGMESELQNCINKTNVDNLYVMIAGNYPPNPSELLSGKYFDAILKVVREKFDYILIDTPPLGAVTDAAIIAKKCDGTAFVIGTERLNRREAFDVIQQLRTSGTRLLGAIRNNVRKKEKSSYYKGRKHGRAEYFTLGKN